MARPLVMTVPHGIVIEADGRGAASRVAVVVGTAATPIAGQAHPMGRAAGEGEMGDMGMLVELGSAFSVLARVLVSASTALFLAYVIYIVGMLSTSSALRAVRRLRGRRAPESSEATE